MENRCGFDSLALEKHWVHITLLVYYINVRLFTGLEITFGFPVEKALLFGTHSQHNMCETMPHRLPCDILYVF